MTTSSCKVVRSGDAYVGRQGLTYLQGLTGGTVGSRGICMVVRTIKRASSSGRSSTGWFGVLYRSREG